MEPQWYYTLQGQQQGPVAESQLRALIQSGQVASNEYVFKEGMPDWAPASSCPELTGGTPAGLPPTAIAGVRSGVGELSIGSIYKEAFDIFKESWLSLCLGVLILFGIAFGVGVFTGIISAVLHDEHNILGNIVNLVINGPMTLGLWILLLNAVDRRQISPMDVLEGFKNFLPAFLLNLLMIIAVLVGLLGLIIGAFIVAFLLYFSWGYMADQRCSAIDAMKQSFQCVKSNFLIVFLLMLLCIPIGIAGFICFIIGIVPAVAFGGLTLAIAYRWLNPIPSA